MFIIAGCNNESSKSTTETTDSTNRDSQVVLIAADTPATEIQQVKLADNIVVTSIPANILQEIKNVPYDSSMVSVPASGFVFKGKVLKCKVLSFDNMGKLYLENINAPWIAIVAEQINLGPQEKAFIEITTSRAVITDGSPYNTRPKAGTGNKGNSCSEGGAGEAGFNGEVGRVPSDGLKIPNLYIITSAIRNEPGNNAPNNYKLYVYTRGVNAGRGGDGQDGQDGGSGGDGGPAESGILGCDCGAGSGGRGGNGGIGGYGHEGGRGGDGGTVYLGGSDAAINIFQYVTFIEQPMGKGGDGGVNGNNGNGGAGGARGEHKGSCKGGSEGAGGTTAAYNYQGAKKGADGENGKTYFSQIDINSILRN